MSYDWCCRCKGSARCDCSCANCKELSGKTENAPCCWQITIAGIVEGTCGSCASLNRVYGVQQNQDEEDSCAWSTRCVLRGGDCDPESISLEVVKDGADYSIVVTLGGHVWIKEYGTSPPDCCNLADEVIPHDTSAGDCDSSSATCTISAWYGTCPTICCDAVAESPDAVRVSLTGMANDDCKHCTCMNSESHYLVQTGDCEWETRTIYCGWCYAVAGGAEMLRLTITAITEGDPVTRTGVRADVRYVGGANQILWSTEFWDDTNPFSWDSPTIAYDSDNGSLCDATGSTLTISAASGAGSSYDTTDRSMACDECGTSGPSSVQVDIDGVENGWCSADCADFDDTYILAEYDPSGQVCQQEWRVSVPDGVPNCPCPGGDASIIGVSLVRYSATKAKLLVWIPVTVAGQGWWAQWIRYIDMAVDCGGFDVTLTDADRTQTYLGSCGGGGGFIAWCDFSFATVRVRAL